MFKTVRRIGIWSVDHVFAIMVGIAALGVGTVLLKNSPAVADAVSEKEKRVAMSRCQLATCVTQRPDSDWRSNDGTEGAAAHAGHSSHDEFHVHGHID